MESNWSINEGFINRPGKKPTLKGGEGHSRIGNPVRRNGDAYELATLQEQAVQYGPVFPRASPVQSVSTVWHALHQFRGNRMGWRGLLRVGSRPTSYMGPRQKAVLRLGWFAAARPGRSVELPLLPEELLSPTSEVALRSGGCGQNFRSPASPWARRCKNLKSIERRPTGSINLPSGTTHVALEQVEVLLARAMLPDESELDRFKVATVIGREIVDDVRRGALRVQHHVTGGSLPKDAPWPLLVTGVVTVSELRSYAASRNVAVAIAGEVGSQTSPLSLETSATKPVSRAAQDAPILSTSETESQASPPPHETSAIKPVSRAEAQDATILSTIERLGYSAMALPKQTAPGQATVKTLIREAIGDKGMWVGKKVFDNAWERLLRAEAIRYAS